MELRGAELDGGPQVAELLAMISERVIVGIGGGARDPRCLARGEQLLGGAARVGFGVSTGRQSIEFELGLTGRQARAETCKLVGERGDVGARGVQLQLGLRELTLAFEALTPAVLVFSIGEVRRAGLREARRSSDAASARSRRS